jgi:hypothetical protein
MPAIHAIGFEMGVPDEPITTPVGISILNFKFRRIQIEQMLHEHYDQAT